MLLSSGEHQPTVCSIIFCLAGANFPQSPAHFTTDNQMAKDNSGPKFSNFPNSVWFLTQRLLSILIYWSSGCFPLFYANLNNVSVQQVSTAAGRNSFDTISTSPDAQKSFRNCSALYFKGKRFIYLFYFFITLPSPHTSAPPPLRKRSTQTNTFLFLRHNFKSNLCGSVVSHVEE